MFERNWWDNAISQNLSGTPVLATLPTSIQLLFKTCSGFEQSKNWRRHAITRHSEKFPKIAKNSPTFPKISKNSQSPKISSLVCQVGKCAHMMDNFRYQALLGKWIYMIMMTDILSILIQPTSLLVNLRSCMVYTSSWLRTLRTSTWMDPYDTVPACGQYK